ncbi:MAG TPA: hypothetical protein VIK52_07680 [Opitutaceae bacterium]
MSPETATPQTSRTAGALGILLLGAALVAGAWLLPVQIRSLSPLLLREAGAGSVSLVESGERFLESERPGPATLIRDAAVALELPGAEALDSKLRSLAEERPELAAWGAWDPFLEPVFGASAGAAPASGERGALIRFLPGSARSSIKGYLANTRSVAVKAIVANASLDKSSRFIPAGRAGGQPLEATILLAAMLMQGNHLSPELARELRAMAEAANRDSDLAPIEEFYFDLLSVGRRLDWGQLTEWLRSCPSAATLGEFAHLLKVAQDRTAVLYSASVVSGMPREVTRYAMAFGSTGVDGIAESLRHGDGAVRQLLLRQVPVNPDVPMALEFLAGLSLRYSLLLTIAKYLGFACGVWLAFRGLDRALMGPVGRGTGRMMMHARSGVIALVFSGILFILSEPFLLRGNPPPDYKIIVSIPALNTLGQLQASPSAAASIDSSTIITVVFFAALQVLVYLICLMKIREVERRDAPILLKLRLMENEENLFDSGLYIGIGGTATALVLQVLGIIDPNLLAAYSSNLFGITCVALVKILHVRPYKRALILRAEQKSG